MRFPWANTALLLLLGLQMVSGYLALINGKASHVWLIWLHGLGAYAIVTLLFFKGAIIWDVLGRGTRWTWARVSFIVLTLLLLAVLILGLLWTFGGLQYLFGFSLVSLHIYLAIPLMLLLAFHAWRKRWIVRISHAVNRRAFLRLGTLTFAGTALYWLANPFKKERRFSGSYEIGSFGGRFPHVSWINDDPQPIAPEQWQLVVDGLVRRPLRITYNQLLAQSQMEMTATIDCTGGWYSQQIWRGVSLRQLLALAEPEEGARSIRVQSVTGYWRRFSVEEAQNYLLATIVAGDVLNHGHGFPARLVVPDQRGFNWVKWVTYIQVSRTSAIWQPPLPLQ